MYPLTCEISRQTADKARQKRQWKSLLFRYLFEILENKELIYRRLYVSTQYPPSLWKSFNAESLKQTQWKGVLEESFIADGQKVSQSYNVGILFYSEKNGKSSVDTYESSFDYSIDNKLLTNVSSMKSSKQNKLSISDFLNIDRRLLWKKTICCNTTQ